MLGVTLTACGLVTANLATWRGRANARHALSALAWDGGPTRLFMVSAGGMVE
jgi:hypothetical protein